MPVLYASSPRRATTQIAGDILLVLWGVFCWIMASYLRDAVLKLADTARSLSQRSGTLASSLDSAATQVAGVPVVGGTLAGPLRQTGESIRNLAGSGDGQANDVTDLAWWVFVAVFAMPFLAACLNWMPRRFAFVREATAARRFINSDEDVELFALRAMAHQPMHRLARISDDPVGAWRSGDSEVIRALARLELADNGLRLPGKRATQSAAPWDGQGGR